jgi:hypothetical protein
MLARLVLRVIVEVILIASQAREDKNHENFFHITSLNNENFTLLFRSALVENLHLTYIFSAEILRDICSIL